MPALNKGTEGHLPSAEKRQTHSFAFQRGVIVFIPFQHELDSINTGIRGNTSHDACHNLARFLH